MARDDASPSSARPRRILLLTVGLLLLPFILKVGIDHVADRKWAQMEAEVAELRRQVSLDESDRCASRGRIAPGDAWEEYTSALNVALQVESLEDLRDQFETWHGKPNPTLSATQAQSLLAPYADGYRHLHSGARRSPGKRPDSWNAAEYEPANGRSPTRILTSLTLWESRRLAESGVPDEAAELLMDLLTFAGDLVRGAGRREGLIADEIQSRALEDLGVLLTSRRLSGPELERVGVFLEDLDGCFPSYRSMLRWTLMETGERMVRNGDHVLLTGAGRLPEGGLNGWRYGFSKRLTRASAFLWLDFWFSRLSEIDRMPWSEVLQLESVFRKDFDGSRNSIVTDQGDWYSPWWAFPHRDVQAHFRLLAMAVSILRTGSCPSKEDPFGDKMRCQISEEGFKLWSVGSDGVDQGGAGEWLDQGKRDIVIEMKR